MSEVSTIGEVIELAITREVQAVQFYAELAERVIDPKMQSLFEALGEEELAHKARLEMEMMKEGLVARSVGRLFEVESPDYMAEGEIPPDLDYQGALDLAIRKERRSFRLYVAMANAVTDDYIHEMLLELAEEEARHLVQFQLEHERVLRKSH